MWVLSIIVGYFVIGLIIHYLIIPVRLPVYSDYFKPGQSFHSKLEGTHTNSSKAGKWNAHYNHNIATRSNRACSTYARKI